MTKTELIARLDDLSVNGHDTEKDHKDADGLLLDYINDKEVAIAYNSIPKWYS